MNIKKNDNILIIAGKDKGKTGKVLQVFNKEKRASVEGLNLLIKHLRPRKKGEKGQRIEFPSPINISNIMIICPSCGRATRVGHKILVGDKKRKVRVCKKCKEQMD